MKVKFAQKALVAAVNEAMREQPARVVEELRMTTPGGAGFKFAGTKRVLPRDEAMEPIRWVPQILLSESNLMPCWIEGLGGLQDAEGGMHEFTHHCADNDHQGLAGDGETLAEGASPGGFGGSDYGRHVQRLAQQSVADFAQARLAAHASARLVLARIQSGKSGGLARAFEA